MCLGLALRTMITATESVTKPCVAFWFQLAGTSPALTSFSTSGSSEKLTTSARSPLATALLCAPEPPYDWLKLTPVPSGVAWKAGISFSKTFCGVEYATSVRCLPDELEEPHAARDRTAASSDRTAGTVRLRIVHFLNLVGQLDLYTKQGRL